MTDDELLRGMKIEPFSDYSNADSANNADLVKILKRQVHQYAIGLARALDQRDFYAIDAQKWADLQESRRIARRCMPAAALFLAAVILGLVGIWESHAR